MKSFSRLFVVLLVIAAIGAALWWFTRPKPIPVGFHTVATGTVEATLANTRAGTVEACQRTKLSTIMGGRIEYLGVKEGDKVKKGQLLLKLWNDDQQAQRTLALAQKDLARQRVGEACTLAANAVREAERIAKLRKDGFVSISREEAARADADARQASCATAKADVQQAQARVRVTEVEQSRTSLIAPFDGTVAKIVGEVGEYSTPSPPGVPTPPAIDLIDASCLYVKAPMDELDAPKIHPGQIVRIRLDAYANRIFAGKVRRVAPYVTAVEKQARTVDVEIDFVAPDEAKGLLVGYSADVEILLETKANVTRIPTATLQDGNRVLVLDAAEGKLVARQIKPGLANWEYTEVLEGLAAGDRIVLSLEKEGVKPGARVVEESTTEKK
ncbi:MAG: efflux RND transporter periplasmic adaptor subunit [Rhodocyclaceae bacterium]|nr:efflux RND transporter periplasmic adaptor subunit [Rhodocyclaceae bacterium]